MKKIRFWVLFIACLVVIGILPATKTAASETEDIVLGGVFPMEFLYGWTSWRGMQIAVEEINAAGGVNVGGKKRLFKLVTMDSHDLEPQINVEDILAQVESLIKKEKPHFLLGGPCRSEAGVAMLDLISKYKIVHILTGGVLTPAYHKKIASDHDKYQYGFRMTSHAGVMSGDFLALFKMIKEKYGLNKIYLMLQNVEHSQKGGEAMSQLFKENGFDVVGRWNYPTGTTDYSIGLLESVEKRANLLFIWMDMPESAILLKQWSDMKVSALPVGFVCPAEQPNFAEYTEGAGEDMVVNLINGGNAPGNITPWTMKFVEAYKNRWGLEPEGYGASSGYMAPYILKAAIERAGTIETQAVVKALEDVDLMGVYGRVRFEKTSHQIIPSADPAEGAVTCIIQWQNGKRVQVYPPKVAEGEIRLPAWIEVNKDSP